MPKLFSTLEDDSISSEKRLSAFRNLKKITTDFSRRNLSNLSLPKDGWNNLNLTEIKCIKCDLSSASLSGTTFIRANLSSAILTKAVLRDAKLNGANLDGANLAEAILDDAMLRGGSFKGTNFTNASLRGAWLMAADFSDAIFDRAVLSRAKFGEKNDWKDCIISGASFVGADLRGINTMHCVVARPINTAKATLDPTTRMHQ